MRALEPGEIVWWDPYDDGQWWPYLVVAPDGQGYLLSRHDVPGLTWVAVPRACLRTSEEVATERLMS